MLKEWDEIKLNEYSYVKGYPFKSEDYKKNGTRIIRVSDIGENNLKNNAPVFISTKSKNKYNKWVVDTNNIIITTVGSKPPMYESIVGKSLRINNESTGMLLNQNNVLIKVSDADLSKLIYENLKTNRYFKYITEIYRGNANQASVNIKELFKYKVLIPKSVDERHAIATSIYNIDQLIKSLQTLIDKKEKIKNGIMNCIFSSNNMHKEELKNLTSMFSGGTPLTSNDEYYRHGNIKWLSISDITNSGKYTNDTIIKITENGLNNSSARLFKKGTLFFAMYASIGKITIATDNMSCSQAILGLECENIDRDYLYHYLKYINEKLKSIGQTGTQSNLSKEIVGKIQISVPNDKLLESKIASTLNNFDNEIDALNEKLSKYKNIKEGMMEDLLTGKVRLSYE